MSPAQVVRSSRKATPWCKSVNAYLKEAAMDGDSPRATSAPLSTQLSEFTTTKEIDMNESDIYTDAQAADEALRMLFRRTRRHTDAETFDAIWKSLSHELRDAIHQAEQRADKLMWTDQEAGITRKFVTIADRVDAEMAAEGITD